MKRILVIDDEQMLLDNIKDLLELYGYDVITSNDSLLILESIENIKPDIILVDIVMPRCDGYEFVTKLREEKCVSDVPVAFITAKIESNDVAKGWKYDISDYIIKPYNIENLVERIENITTNFRRH